MALPHKRAQSKRLGKFFLTLNSFPKEGREYRLYYEISLFRDTFYFNKLQFGNYTREGGKSIHFLESSLQDQFRNCCFTTMAIAVRQIFGTKVSYYTMLYELTKNECFHSSFSGGGLNFACGVIRAV